ncbi:hypothetical protein HU200_033083 [Digitaria exilis]|uniref:CCHC-type domain-containing protein n=1 Tax=Digitaria exilis TaxID=1010633 RepID=A0A835BLQ1_9POAL|nr:hypothetical protein HU200_033083 [Digitaria exilis]
MPSLGLPSGFRPLPRNGRSSTVADFIMVLLPQLRTFMEAIRTEMRDEIRDISINGLRLPNTIAGFIGQPIKMWCLTSMATSSKTSATPPNILSATHHTGAFRAAQAFDFSDTSTNGQKSDDEQCFDYTKQVFLTSSSVASTGCTSGIQCHCFHGTGHVKKDCRSQRAYLATEYGGYISTSDIEDDDEEEGVAEDVNHHVIHDETTEVEAPQQIDVREAKQGTWDDDDACEMAQGSDARTLEVGKRRPREDVRIGRCIPGRGSTVAGVRDSSSGHAEQRLRGRRSSWRGCRSSRRNGGVATEASRAALRSTGQGGTVEARCVDAESRGVGAAPMELVVRLWNTRRRARLWLLGEGARGYGCWVKELADTGSRRRQADEFVPTKIVDWAAAKTSALQRRNLGLVLSSGETSSSPTAAAWKLFILSSHPRAMNRKPSSPLRQSFSSPLLLLLPLLQICLPIAGAARTPPARADPARDIGAIRFLGSVYTRLLAQNCYVFTGVRFTVLETPPPSNDYTAPRLLPARLRRTDCTASTDLPASNLYDYFEQGQSRNIMSSDDIPPAGNGATNAPGRGPAPGYFSIAFEVKDNLFRGCILGVIAPHLINPLLKKKSGKEMWDALDAQYGVSDAGSELYLMEQFLDYRMVEDRPVVEQANELHVLAKDLGCCNKENPCVLPDKFVAGGIIFKLPPSWRDFATSLKHRRQEFTIDGLIGSLDVEEKARAKDGKGKKPPQPQNPGKAKQTTGYKKKKGACYVCGSEDHFAGKCPQRKEGKFILSSHPRAMNRKSSSPLRQSFSSPLLLLLPLLQICLPIAGAARTPPARADPARDIGAIRFLGSVYTRLLAQNCYVFTGVRFTVLETPPPSNDYTAPRLLPARLRRTDCTASTDLPASNLYDYFEQGQSRNIMSSDDIPPAGNGATNAPGRGPAPGYFSIAFEVKDNLFRGCILGVIAPHLINPLLKKKSGKEMWDALDAQYGVSDAGSELYLMEQFLDYRMVEDRPVVEQANELHVLAKDLGCCNKENPCVLPDKFVAGGIIFKLPPSWRDFATSLKHRRQEFTIDGLIGSLDVEEKARAKDGKGKKPPQPQNPGKAKQTTGYKKKKGACYVCGSEDHFAGKCPQRKEGKFILSSHPRAMNRKSSSPLRQSFSSPLLLLLPLLQICLPIAGAARTPPARADPARDIGAIRFLGSVYTRLLAQNCYVFTGVRFTVLETPPPSNDYTAPRLLPARLRRTDCTASTDLPASNLYDYFEQGQSRNIMSSDDIPPAGNGATNAPGRGPAPGYFSIAFEVKDNLFRGCILGVIAPHLINPLLKKKSGKEMWDALDAQYGVSDAGSELYLMEQFLDYRMVEDRPVVEQANELHVLAKDLGCCNKENPCVLPDKFVAGGIISKLPPSWRDFATSLKHRRQEFTIDGLIGSLDVEEKARAKDGKGKKPPQPQNPGKAKQTTGYKKKKGACYVCGSEDHFAGKCPQRKEGKFILSSHPRAMNRKSSSPLRQSFSSPLLLLLPLLQICLPIAGAARTPPARADPARDIGAIRFLGSVYTRLLAQNCYVFTGVRFTVLETPPPSNDYTAPRLLPARLRRTDCTASTDLPASNLYDYFEQGQSRNIMSSDDILPAGNGATNAPGRAPNDILFRGAIPPRGEKATHYTAVQAAGVQRFDPSSQRSSGAARRHPCIFIMRTPSLPGCPSAISRAPVASLPQSPFDTPDKTPGRPVSTCSSHFVSSTVRKQRAQPIEENQSMALSCMRCPAGAAAASSPRAAAAGPAPAAAISFTRCGFGRSAAAAAGCWRIQAVTPQGGVARA